MLIYIYADIGLYWHGIYIAYSNRSIYLYEAGIHCTPLGLHSGAGLGIPKQCRCCRHIGLAIDTSAIGSLS